jgi:ketosteroid isomerase-like protein
MSEANVEIVLAALQDFNQRRRVNPALWHDDSRLTGPEGWPERGPWRGKPDVLRQFDRLFEDFSKFAIEDVQVIGHDGDWVAIAYRWHTRGIGSGIEDVTDMTVAFRIRDGRFTEAHYRWTREQALEAAGLAE